MASALCILINYGIMDLLVSVFVKNGRQIFISQHIYYFENDEILVNLILCFILKVAFA